MDDVGVEASTENCFHQFDLVRVIVASWVRGRAGGGEANVL